MTRKTELMFTVIIVGIVDAAIPFFPIFALVLAYVLIEKPVWFLDWVQEIYRSN